MVVPLLALGMGGVWYSHAWLFWNLGMKDGRWSGMALLLLALPMMGSGYALQVVVNEGWKTAWLWTHWVYSGVWVAAYAGHWRLQWRKRRTEREGVG